MTETTILLASIGIVAFGILWLYRKSRNFICLLLLMGALLIGYWVANVWHEEILKILPSFLTAVRTFVAKHS